MVSFLQKQQPTEICPSKTEVRQKNPQTESLFKREI